MEGYLEMISANAFTSEKMDAQKWNEVTISLRARTKARPSVLWFHFPPFWVVYDIEQTHQGREAQVQYFFISCVLWPIISSVYMWGPPSLVQWIFWDRVVDLLDLELIKWRPERQSSAPQQVSCLKLVPLRESYGWCQAEHHLTGSRERET